MKKYLIYIPIVLTFLIWGNSFIAIEVALEELTPWELLAFRFFPVFAFCLSYLLLFERRTTLELMREYPARITFMGLCSVILYNIFLNTGELQIPSGTASILIALNPAFTFLLSVMLKEEKPSMHKVWGLIIAFLGMYIVVAFGAGQRIDFSYYKAALITVLAPLSWALYTITAKPVLKKHSPVVVTFSSILIGSLPVFYWFRMDFLTKIISLSGTTILSVMYLSVFCTIIGFFIWSWTLQRVSPTRVASFVYLNPFFTVIFSAILLGHRITPFLLLGGTILLLGIFTVTYDFNNVPFRNNKTQI